MTQKNASKFAIFLEYKNPHRKNWNILLDHFIKHKPFISEECVDFVIILITTLCLTLFVTDLWTAGPFRDNSMKDRKRKIAERNGSVSIKWSEKKILSIALCPNLTDSEYITNYNSTSPVATYLWCIPRQYYCKKKKLNF